MSQTLIKVVKEGDSLFGKAFKWLKDEGDYVLLEIETEVGKVEKWFHREHVVATTATIATPAQIENSTVALTVAPVA